jgi:hypothetical protein
VVWLQSLAPLIEKIVDRYIYRQEYDPEQYKRKPLVSALARARIWQDFSTGGRANGIETALLAYRRNP